MSYTIKNNRKVATAVLEEVEKQKKIYATKHLTKMSALRICELIMHGIDPELRKETLEHLIYSHSFTDAGCDPFRELLGSLNNDGEKEEEEKKTIKRELAEVSGDAYRVFSELYRIYQNTSERVDSDGLIGFLSSEKFIKFAEFIIEREGEDGDSD